MCLTPCEKWSCGLFDRPLVVGCSTGHKPHPLHVNEWGGKGKGSGVWPSMVTHTRNLSSAFNPSKCTLTAVNHTRSSGQPYCGARGAVGGSVPCSRVSPQSWYWRWREHLLFTPPTDIPCRTWESNLQPLGYKSNSLTIRPRLPPSPNWGWDSSWLKSQWDLSQNKKINYTSKTIFQNMVLVI